VDNAKCSDEAHLSVSGNLNLVHITSNDNLYIVNYIYTKKIYIYILGALPLD